jgi:hypothetical protein
MVAYQVLLRDPAKWGWAVGEKSATAKCIELNHVRAAVAPRTHTSPGIPTSLIIHLVGQQNKIHRGGRFQLNFSNNCCCVSDYRLAAAFIECETRQ